jgi:dihydrodipicolinate synthase/N-acetylneuraminate lyase
LKKITGPIVAILTPFTQTGSVDFSSLGRYLAFLAACGVQAIVVNGTSAEFASLTFGERQELLEYCRKHFTGVLINNISASCVRDVQELAKNSDVAADYLLLLPPFYYAKPRESGVSRFFEEALRATELPVFLYNFPFHVQFIITPSFVKALVVKCPNIVGIKDSSGTLETAKGFASVSESFQVFVGNDSLCYEVLRDGLSGSITGAGNAFPECLVKIREYFENGETEKSIAMQVLFKSWNDWRRQLSVDEVSVTKMTLSIRLEGFPPYVRAPLADLSGELAKEVRDKAAQFESKMENYF